MNTTLRDLFREDLALNTTESRSPILSIHTGVDGVEAAIHAVIYEVVADCDHVHLLEVAKEKIPPFVHDDKYFGF